MTEPLLHYMLSSQMSYMTERQTVLAHNMANIDTPGYKAQDLKKLDFARMASSENNHLFMRATSRNHLSGTLTDEQRFADEKVRKPFEISPMANNVVLEEQMAKISDTGAQFNIASTLYKKYNQLYLTSVGKGA